ncbi:MAG: cellulase family glycosylhydrolase [Bacteroidetes bacterium]|nr:cellulase family glycosylhydrolase [Bacteroidota bacterium]MBT7463609.1 cellulase family glycosylhydrolase [Bacteroidota bacterium]
MTIKIRRISFSSMLLLSLLLLIFLGSVSCQQNNRSIDNGYKNGVYNENGILKLRGEAFYGIGVNYYSLFVRVLDKPEDKSYVKGLEQLSSKGIPFVRFRAGGFESEDWALYQQNKKAHFAAMDKVVKEAEKQNIGLIPSLFWTLHSVPVFVDELVDEYGNDDSKTIAFVREYTSELLERYKDSPAIWAWEFGNESNLFCDMPVQVFGLEIGEFTSGETLQGETMVNAYQEFAKVIREYDQDRIIITGNSEPRKYIWNNIHGTLWKTDTREQYREILLRDNPEEINTISIRAYYNSGDELPIETTDFNDFLAIIKPWADSVGKPIVVGEFGAKEDYNITNQEGDTVTISTKQAFTERIDAILENKIQLSALWVFDFDEQNENSGNYWNVTFLNSRSYMLDAIVKANAYLRESR